MAALVNVYQPAIALFMTIVTCAAFTTIADLISMCHKVKFFVGHLPKYTLLTLGLVFGC